MNNSLIELQSALEKGSSQKAGISLQASMGSMVEESISGIVTGVKQITNPLFLRIHVLLNSWNGGGTM